MKDIAGHPPRGEAVNADWTVRIERHLTLEGEVAVPPRVANWLEVKTGLTSAKRGQIRSTDPEAYEVLMALHLAALRYGSGFGTKSATRRGNSRQLETWLTTAEAAILLGVTDRAVRKRIETGRLPATKRGGRWLLNRNHIELSDSLG